MIEIISAIIITAIVVSIIVYNWTLSHYKKKLTKELRQSKLRYGIFEVPLQYKKDNIKFNVTAECDEIARTEDEMKIKVKIRNIIVDDNIVASDAGKMASIKAHLDGKWMPHYEIKWFMEKNVRMEKIQKFLDEI